MRPTTIPAPLDDMERQDEAIGLPDVAALVALPPATIWNWCNRGVTVRIEGHRRKLFLDADLIGGRYRTSRRKVRSFLEAIQESRHQRIGAPVMVSRRAEAAQAKAEKERLLARLRGPRSRQAPGTTTAD